MNLKVAGWIERAPACNVTMSGWNVGVGVDIESSDMWHMDRTIIRVYQPADFPLSRFYEVNSGSLLKG